MDDQEDSNESFVFKDIDRLEAQLKRCTDCCNGDYSSYHCPLCPITQYKPRQISKVKLHLHVHWKAGVIGNNGMTSVICHLQHGELTGRHYHCSTCCKIIKKKQNMVHHARSCMVKELSNIQVGSHDNENIELGSSNFEHSYTVGTKVSCKENVKRKRKIACVSDGRAEISQHHTVIVSPSEGIFCSTINIRGPGYPVHLIKKTAGDNTESFCEHLSCIETKETAVRGNNITFECPHLISTPYAVPGKVISLTSESLQELKDNNFITEARFNDLLAWKNSLTCTRVPLAVTIPQKQGSSQRYLYLSIYTGVQRYWSRTGRTIVTIDTSRNTVTCKCSNTARYCLHKAIGKWYMFQELHQSVDYTSPDETEESGPKISEDDMVNEKLKKANLEVDLEYLQSKRIPSIIPKVASYQHDQVQNNTFSPKETHCHICSGGLKSEVVSTRSKVISMTKIVKDVKVYIKMCPRCRTTYRYQEWEDGIHNFNNSLLIGLDVCSFLRAGIQNHVALGRTLSVLEDVLQEKLNFMEVEKAYLHFEAMSDHDYNFNCVLCGYHPAILIWDTFRKARFQYPVSDLRFPTTESGMNETVNVRSFWQRIERSIVLAGMNRDLSKDVMIKPNFEEWSPWVGEMSRIGDDIYNTEYKKCIAGISEEIDEPMPEELLSHLLLDEKVSNIRNVCREAGVRADGSTMDMVLRLRQMSITRSCFNKAYEKVFGCTGGWAVGCCRHGIVYGIKNLLRSESPRDYIDLERSLKHRPNVTICDIAHLLATHGNKTVEDFYCPNEGRLDIISEENIQAAESGKKWYSLSFLNTHPHQESSSSDSNYNPTTGSSDHLSLYDWFHQNNTKKREETLRRCSLVREISGLVDTQTVEQLFSSSRKDLYFLNNLTPTNHMFQVRLIHHLRNTKNNLINMKKVQKALGCSLKFNTLGQICQNYPINTVENAEENVCMEVLEEERIDNIIDLEQEATDLEQEATDLEQEATDLEQEATDLEQEATVSSCQKINSNQTENSEISVEILKFQTEETKILKETFTALIDSSSNLTEEETAIILRNMRYANQVLFQKAEDHRRNQVLLTKTNFGNFQTQGSSNYCGLCSLNNIIGIPDEGPIVTIDDMDLAADQLWLSMGDNPSYGFIAHLEPMRDKEGFYSIEVMQRVFQDQGYDIIPLNTSSLQTLSSVEIGISVCNQLSKIFGMASLIIRPSFSQHWLSIKLVQDTILLLDSKLKSPIVLTFEELGNIIIANITPSRGVTGAIYCVIHLQNHDMSISMDDLNVGHTSDSLQFCGDNMKKMPTKRLKENCADIIIKEEEQDNIDEVVIIDTEENMDEKEKNMDEKEKNMDEEEKNMDGEERNMAGEERNMEKNMEKNMDEEEKNMDGEERNMDGEERNMEKNMDGEERNMEKNMDEEEKNMEKNMDEEEKNMEMNMDEEERNMDGEEKNMDEEEENINEEEENIEEEEEDLPSAISDENKEKRYRLRENAKKRRSASYVFPSWKSGKKTHCICLKKNDGRSYWLCDTCERWYHPSCIGYLEEEVPIVFDCPQCLELARRRNQSKSKSDERETVKAFPVSLYHTQKEAFMKYLDKIMTCSDIGCAKPDHERHHEFMNDPSMVYNRERNTHCFGKNLFNNQEMIEATECLLSELVYKNTPYKNPYSSWYWSIRELPDCKLKSIFKEHKMYANDYVRYIAGKEMVLFIHCYLTGCSYDAANESAKRTEVKISDILRKKIP